MGWLPFRINKKGGQPRFKRLKRAWQAIVGVGVLNLIWYALQGWQATDFVKKHTHGMARVGQVLLSFFLRPQVGLFCLVVGGVALLIFSFRMERGSKPADSVEQVVTHEGAPSQLPSAVTEPAWPAGAPHHWRCAVVCTNYHYFSYPAVEVGAGGFEPLDGRDVVCPECGRAEGHNFDAAVPLGATNVTITRTPIYRAMLIRDGQRSHVGDYVDIRRAREQASGYVQSGGREEIRAGDQITATIDPGYGDLIPIAAYWEPFGGGDERAFSEVVDGGPGPIEEARRANILAKLRTEYALSHDDLTPQFLAGTAPIPKEWVEERLAQMGEEWHQEEYW